MNRVEDVTPLTIYKALRSDTQKQLHEIVSREAASLTSVFYDFFLRNEEASHFLSHDTVHRHLNASLERWLKKLFDPSFPEIDNAAQKAIGKVHAHLGIPIHLVLQGAILLKSELGSHLIQAFSDPEQLADVILFSCNRIDKAMALMSAAYVSDTKKNVQEAEAYRAMSFGQNLASEREGQHVALMEWSQSFLFALVTHENLLPSLSASPLGLWLRHRASILFSGMPELGELNKKVADFDAEFSSKSQLINIETQQAFTIHFQAAVDELKRLLSTLFHKHADACQGVDSLTTLLNKRFLSAILSREVSTAVHEHLPLSVMVIDIHNFGEINNQYGHHVGDAIVKQVSERLQKSSRASDFLFRYSGKDFLLVLVETSLEEAKKISVEMKRSIHGNKFCAPDLTEVTVKIAFGVASYDGHPDPNYMVRSAFASMQKPENTLQ